MSPNRNSAKRGFGLARLDLAQQAASRRGFDLVWSGLASRGLSWHGCSLVSSHRGRPVARLVPYPKLRLLDLCREVLRFKQMSIRTQEGDATLGMHRMLLGVVLHPVVARRVCDGECRAGVAEEDAVGGQDGDVLADRQRGYSPGLRQEGEGGGSLAGGPRKAAGKSRADAMRHRNRPAPRGRTGLTDS